MSLTDIGNMDNMGNIEEFYVINRKGKSVQLDFNKILSRLTNLKEKKASKMIFLEDIKIKFWKKKKK